METVKSNTKPAKIVVVDDDEKNLWMMREMLGHYQLSIFSTINEAKQQIPKIRPDVVLLDFFMPDGNGGDLCLDLQKIPELRATKFFIVSGHDQIKEKMAGKGLEAYDYIVKPYSAKELCEKIRACMQPPLKKAN